MKVRFDPEAARPIATTGDQLGRIGEPTCPAGARAGLPVDAINSRTSCVSPVDDLIQEIEAGETGNFWAAAGFD